MFSKMLKLAGALTLALATILALLLVLNGRPAWAATTNVPAGSSLQAAILAANDGDTLLVQSGVFTDSLVITKSLTLLGGYDATFLDINRTPRSTLISPTGQAISITGVALVVRVDGFEIANADFAGPGAGIGVDVEDDSRITIHDNYIHDNIVTGTITSDGGGIWADLDNRSDLYITSNDIMSNTSGDDAAGLYADVYLSGTLTIRNNQVVSNTASGNGGGMYARVWVLSVFHVDDNTFERNTATDYGGLYLSGEENVNGAFDRNLLLDNVASDSNAGAYIRLDRNVATTFDDNVFRGNQAGSSTGGLGLNLDSNSRVVGNRMIVDGNQASGSYGGANVDMNEGVVFTMTQGISVTNNVAGDDTGGIRFYAMYSRASVPNMYIYNNRVLNGSRGGFYLSYGDAGGMFDARNATVISNTAVYIGDVSSGGGGYISLGDGSYADLSGSRFERNQADRGGGLYGSSLDEGSTLLLNDVQIISNAAYTDGGGLHLSMPDEFSWLEMNNTLIMSNTAAENGGGLYTRSQDDGSEFSFDNNIIVSNTAGSDGGGIYLGECSQGCILSVDDNVFADNHAGGSGGGYYQDGDFADEGGIGTFNRNQVISNTAGGGGGGIYMTGDIARYGGHAQFNDNWIEGNRSHGDGGGMRIDDMADSATAEFIGNTVINNLAEDGNGGGIRMDDIAYYGSLVYFRDNVISGNVISSTGSYNGGGIRIYGVGDGDTLWMTGNVFNNNVATGKGGGFFFDSDIDYASEVYFEDNELQYNQAQEGGGCYWDDDWEDGGPVTFKNNVVNNNVAVGNYGGCYFDAIDEGVVAYISGNQFNDNTAAGDHGGVHIDYVYDGAMLYFYDNEIIGNRAGISNTQVTGGHYGGLYIERIDKGGEVQFYNNLITGNMAYFTYTLGITPTGGSYGGMYARLENGGELVMDENVIADNAAQDSYGGLAIRIQAARLAMDHNLITANTAITTGGGLHITGTLDGMYHLWHNQIVDNSAADQGGLALESNDGTLWGFSENNLIAGNSSGVSLWGANWRSINDTVADNGDYGLWIKGSLTTTAYLSNTILWGHTEAFSSTHPATQTMEADYSDIQLSSGVWPGVGNWNADPLFIGGSDYHLQATSPLIDQADAAVAPARDLDDILRPVGAGADMGAYEFHLSGVTVAGDGSLSGDPGTWVTHIVTITNDGDAEDEFALAFSGNVWTSTLAAESVTLAGGVSTTIDLLIYVPDDASAGDSDTVNVDAVSTRNALVVDTDSVDTQANLVPDVDVYPDNTAGITAGSIEIYYHTVTNLSNGAETFTLGAVSSQGWVVQVIPANVTLGEGLSTTVKVRITVPEGVGGQIDITTLTVTSTSDGSISDSAIDTTVAIDAVEVDVSLTPNNASTILVGNTQTYTHTLTNNSSTTDTLSLILSSDQGWAANVTPTSLDLGVGENALVTVTLAAPASGPNGLVDITLIWVASANAGGDVAAAAADVTTLLNAASLALSADQALDAAPGSVVVYTHTLTNNGAAMDTFALTALSDQGWTVQLDQSALTLQPGASADIVLQVSVPAGAAESTVDVTVLTATSKYGSAAHVSNSSTTTVVSDGNFIFLPLVVDNF